MTVETNCLVVTKTVKIEILAGYTITFYINISYYHNRVAVSVINHRSSASVNSLFYSFM